MEKRTSGSWFRACASILAFAIGVQTSVVHADTTTYAQTTQPPAGQYAPPPKGSEPQGSTYDQRAQEYDRQYAEQYSRWAARNCVDQRNNTVAGAAIGGVLGAILGSGAAGRGAHLAGAVAGGTLGATAGAAIGSSADRSQACPPGYVVASGAPAFQYSGPPYPVEVIYGPAWYQPWVWVGGHWVFHPYRYWYWSQNAYWRPGWRPGVWRYSYRRW